jgi:hypothetical protein
MLNSREATFEILKIRKQFESRNAKNVKWRSKESNGREQLAYNDHLQKELRTNDQVQHIKETLKCCKNFTKPIWVFSLIKSE